MDGGTGVRETRATTLSGAVAAGRGRGRGANIIAAWMANGGGPRAAQAAAGADAHAESGAATGEAVGPTAGAAEGAAQAVALAPSGPRPHPDNWESLTKAQREQWRKNMQKVGKGKRFA